jgi:hypothetical protein
VKPRRLEAISVAGVKFKALFCVNTSERRTQRDGWRTGYLTPAVSPIGDDCGASMANVISMNHRRKASTRSALLNDLHIVKSGMDAGWSPGEIVEIEASRCRYQIEHIAARLANYTNPHAAAAFLRKLADQMEPQAS